jgi:hypothetical protein
LAVFFFFVVFAVFSAFSPTGAAPTTAPVLRAMRTFLPSSTV